jgi:hypothetical protein
MWCEVQVCRGPTGERLKRSDWKAVGRGKLSIYSPPSTQLGTLVASLDRLDVDKYYPLVYPIFDVRVATFDAGLLVVGYQTAPEAGTDVIREYRQAWYCVPVAGP